MGPERYFSVWGGRTVDSRLIDTLNHRQQFVLCITSACPQQTHTHQ